MSLNQDFIADLARARKSFKEIYDTTEAAHSKNVEEDPDLRNH
jgi:hypothetical protein